MESNHFLPQSLSRSLLPTKISKPVKMTRIVRVALGLTFTAFVPVLGAQNEGPPRGAGPRRDMLEQRLRERTAEIVQRRLQLTDVQMKQLQAVNRQFEQQRGSLIAREREIRRDLRA